MKCDSCGAPVENGKCTYCGKTFIEPQKATNANQNNNTYIHINNYQGQNVNLKQPKKKSGCGTILWIFIVLVVIGVMVKACGGDSGSDSTTSGNQKSSAWTTEYADIEDFDYYIDGSEIYLQDYNGSDKKVRINSTYTIDGTEYNVVSLDGTFTLHSVDSVIVPEGVKYISDNTFNSDGVQFVYLPSTLEEISSNFMSYFHDMNKICYGGSEEQWNSLVTCERSDIEVKQIEFDVDSSTLQ